MQTEKAKSSHFDRTRGFKNQIFPTCNRQRAGFNRISKVSGQNIKVQIKFDIFFCEAYLLDLQRIEELGQTNPVDFCFLE